MISLAAIGSTVANSKTAQYALIAGLILVIFLYWLRGHDRKLLAAERALQERKSRLKQKEIEKENDERLDQANATRAAFRGGTRRASELSEPKRKLLIGD